MARLPPDAELPAWAASAVSAPPAAGAATPGTGSSAFVSVTRTHDELSIVAPSERVPAEVRAERDLALLRVEGSINFAAVGVLRSLLEPLANAGISVCALSTFDTDYLLLRREVLDGAVEALGSAGFVVA